MTRWEWFFIAAFAFFIIICVAGGLGGLDWISR